MPPDLDDDWADLGYPQRKLVQSNIPKSSSLEAALDWTDLFDEGNRLPFFTLMGGVQDRVEFCAALNRELSTEVSQRTDWLVRGPLAALQEYVEWSQVDPLAMDLLPPWWPPTKGTWRLLWGLVALPDLMVEEPLRSMVDRGHSVFHWLFRGIWEARFILREQNDLTQVDALIEALGTWASGRVLEASDEVLLTPIVQRRLGSEQERVSMLCFLLMLAAQNGLLSKSFLLLDRIERAESDQLKELFLVLQGCLPWAKMPGFPLGILVGWSGDSTKLKRSNAKLADLLAKGVA